MATIWLLVLVATLAWGFWGIFDKKAVATASPPVVLLISTLAQAVVALVAIVALRMTGQPIDWKSETLVWGGLSGLAIAGGMIAYLYALAQRDASWVLGITAGYPAIMVVVAVLWLGESVSLLRLAGIGIVMLGIYLIGLE
jgi:bacterial/archaeal transporter family protein